MIETIETIKMNDISDIVEDEFVIWDGTNYFYVKDLEEEN